MSLRMRWRAWRARGGAEWRERVACIPERGSVVRYDPRLVVGGGPCCEQVAPCPYGLNAKYEAEVL